jgi:hypothetical protein
VAPPAGKPPAPTARQGPRRVGILFRKKKSHDSPSTSRYIEGVCLMHAPEPGGFLHDILLDTIVDKRMGQPLSRFVCLLDKALKRRLLLIVAYCDGYGKAADSGIQRF